MELQEMIDLYLTAGAGIVATCLIFLSFYKSNLSKKDGEIDELKSKLKDLDEKMTNQDYKIENALTKITTAIEVTNQTNQQLKEILIRLDAKIDGLHK